VRANSLNMASASIVSRPKRRRVATIARCFWRCTSDRATRSSARASRLGISRGIGDTVPSAGAFGYRIFPGCRCRNLPRFLAASQGVPRDLGSKREETPSRQPLLTDIRYRRGRRTTLPAPLRRAASYVGCFRRPRSLRDTGRGCAAQSAAGDARRSGSGGPLHLHRRRGWPNPRAAWSCI
jgi:hypothetical protein